ncbi:MAG: YegS/Rv2252/BmrU family lipid kinase [bacterium]
MYFFIYNPTAGTRWSDKQLNAFRKLLQEKFRRHQFTITVEPKDATIFAKQALELQSTAVIVIGGDGTVHEAIQALAQTHIPLGIIPTGNNNTLAQALEIPEKTEDAVNYILNSKETVIDLGQIDRKTFFATNFSIGIKVNPANKSIFGHIQSALKLTHSLTLSPTTLQLKFNEQELKADFSVLSLSNLIWPFEGRFGTLASNPNDGKLDLFTISQLNNRKEMIHILSNEHFSSEKENLSYFKLKDIIIENNPMNTTTADGEHLELTDSTKIRAVAKALTLLVPDKKTLAPTDNPV